MTLIELLAVAVILILLASLVVGLGVYSQRRAKVARAEAELGRLEDLIQTYYNDRGMFPTSTAVAISQGKVYEAVNSMLLYQQLTNAGFAAALPNLVRRMSIGTNLQEHSEIILFSSACVGELYGVDGLIDPWMTPYNYYCPWPRITSVSVSILPAPCSRQVVMGGQRNPATFDLWSYGPDRATSIYLPPSYTSRERALDDISNFH